MNEHIETRLVWFPVETYKNKSDSGFIAMEPEVLLWHPRHGTVLGRVMRFADEVINVASGYHGFNFSHYAQFETPRDAGAV